MLLLEKVNIKIIIIGIIIDEIFSMLYDDNKISVVLIIVNMIIISESLSWYSVFVKKMLVFWNLDINIIIIIDVVIIKMLSFLWDIIGIIIGISSFNKS